MHGGGHLAPHIMIPTGVELKVNVACREQREPLRARNSRRMRNVSGNESEQGRSENSSKLQYKRLRKNRNYEATFT